MRSKTKVIISSLVLLLITSIITITAFNNSNEDEVKLAGFNNITEFYPSNRHTYQDDTKIAVSQAPENLSVTPSELVRTIQTEAGTVELNEQMLSFNYTNSKGYKWSSTVNDVNTLFRSGIILNAYNTNSDDPTPLYYDLFDANVNVTEITNGFSAHITFATLKIQLKLEVTFTNEGIHISIPSSSIKENGIYLISDIVVYPYLGAVENDKVPGYIFAPDGVGALIRYKSRNVSGNYEKNIYGKNLGLSDKDDLNKEAAVDANIYAPVFGMVHGVNQNALFAIIEDGAEYGSINIEYAGALYPYSTIYPRFTYRNTYTQPMDKSGTTIKLLQKEKNPFDINIKYVSLVDNDANYIGMAKTYQEYLKKEQGLTQKAVASDINLRLDTIGIERTKGVLFDQKILMTSFSDYKNILDTLTEKQVKNIVGVYNGFTNDGVSWAAPNFKKFSNKLGTQSELNDLLNNYNIYFATEYQKATSKAGGYNSYFDLAKKINDQRYTYVNSDYEAYLLTHSKTAEVLKESVSKLGKDNIKNLYIQSMGSLLYSDLSNNVSLVDARNFYVETLKEVEGNVALSNVNSYLWGSIDEFFDFPLYNSQRLAFDDTVPFLAITLGNYMNLYSSYANFYAYPREELLRLIDYNVYPSFIVTHESSNKLEETNLNHIYSSRYEDLEDAIVTYYEFVNTPLKNVIGSSLTSRIVVQNGVVINEYSNGVKIIVNYTNQTQNVNGVEVQPMYYHVTGGEN